MQQNIEKKNGFGAVLRRDFKRINDGLAQSTQWYVEVAGHTISARSSRLCEFALWLACQPQRLPELYDRDLDTLFHLLRSCPAILRGARMLALLSANQGQNGTDTQIAGVDMVIAEIMPEDVLDGCRKALGLPVRSGDPIDETLLAGLLRRSSRHPLPLFSRQFAGSAS